MEAQQVYECQICEFEIEIQSNTEVNEIIECFDCGTEYEVISLAPIILEELEAVAEDWGQ